MSEFPPESEPTEAKIKCFRVPFARRRSDRKIVDAKLVPSGKKCDCECVVCQVGLIARHPRKSKRIHHFAHMHDPNRPCKAAAETSLHKAAKQIVAEMPSLSLPKSTYFAARVFKVMEAHIERPFIGFQPDVYLKDERGDALAVEIQVSHEVDQEKRIRLCNAQMNTIEIDLRKAPRMILYEDLAKLLNDYTYPIAWIFHNGDAKMLEELNAKAEEDRLARIEIQNQFHEEKRRREQQERRGKWAHLMPWAYDPPKDL